MMKVNAIVSRKEKDPVDVVRPESNRAAGWMCFATFSLEDNNDFPASFTTGNELENLMREDPYCYSSDLMDADNLGVVRWSTTAKLGKVSIYPEVKEVVLRIYDTAVFSCRSERKFSAVNRIVTHDRTRLKYSIAGDQVFSISALK